LKGRRKVVFKVTAPKFTQNILEFFALPWKIKTSKIFVEKTSKKNHRGDPMVFSQFLPLFKQTCVCVIWTRHDGMLLNIYVYSLYFGWCCASFWFYHLKYFGFQRQYKKFQNFVKKIGLATLKPLSTNFLKLKLASTRPLLTSILNRKYWGYSKFKKFSIKLFTSFYKVLKPKFILKKCVKHNSFNYF